MNGYICYYENSTCEVRANTTVGAQDVAIAVFLKMHPRKRIKTHQITVVLAEKGSTPTIHTAA